MAGHRKLQVRFCNIIDSWHQTGMQFALNRGTEISFWQTRLAHKLKLKAYIRIRVSRRDEKVRSKRKTRCRLLLNRFTAEKVKNIIFTDENDFTLEVARNRQNDRVYGKRKRDIAPNRLYHETSRFTKNLLEFLGKEKPGFTLSIRNVLK